MLSRAPVHAIVRRWAEVGDLLAIGTEYVAVSDLITVDTGKHQRNGTGLFGSFGERLLESLDAHHLDREGTIVADEGQTVADTYCAGIYPPADSGAIWKRVNTGDQH